MAEPRARHGPLQVLLDYSFDRLHDSKIAQAYSLLVPGRQRPTGGSVKELDHENGGNLRTSIVRAATGCEHDSESDGIAARVRQESGTGGPKRVGSSKMTAIAERRWSDLALSM